MSINVAASPETKEHDWMADLCQMMLAGIKPEDAASRIVRVGIPYQEAAAAAHEIESHPLFQQAKRIRVQLECRDWLLGAYASLEELRQDPHLIETHEDVNKQTFLRDFYLPNRALFLPGVAAGWKAVKRWNREYLRKVCGAETIEVMIGREGVPVPDQNTSDALRESMLFEDYLDLLYSGGRSNDYYLVARNRFFDQPNTRRLVEDIGSLNFVNTTSAPSSLRLWLGPAGTNTALHYDARNNLLVQVLGVKNIRLYSPHYSRWMQQTQPWYAGVDPGLMESDSYAPPALSVRLCPGDALFIPVGWWHAIVADEVSLTLSFLDFGLPNPFRDHSSRDHS